MFTREQRGVLLSTLMIDGLDLTSYGWSHDLEALVQAHNSGTCGSDCPVPPSQVLVVIERDARPRLIAEARS